MRLPQEGLKRPQKGGRGRRLAAVVLIALAGALAGVPAVAGDWKDRLSVKMGGGLNVLGWGDVGALKDSYQEQVRSAAEQFGIATTGTCENPRLGWQGEAEICIDLNSRLSLGLAVGRDFRRGETVLNADWIPFLRSKHIWNQGSTITPVSASAYWHFPLGARSRAYVKAGAGLASAVWKYKIRDEETIDSLSWEQIEGTARDQGPLVQAGLGYEIRVAKRLTAFVEARCRLLFLAGWRADHTHATDASSETISGRVWLAEVMPSGGRPAQTWLLVSESPPAASLYSGVRSFRLNLSGGIFQIGLRLGLGSSPSPSSPQ